MFKLRVNLMWPETKADGDGDGCKYSKYREGHRNAESPADPASQRVRYQPTSMRKCELGGE
jgi:hypothetical protein